MENLRFVDLFAGIGGFRYGLCQADKSDRGNPSSTGRKLLQGAEPPTPTFECVWSNEWDKYASQIYRKHYGEIDTRDITTVPASEIPDHDLLTAGFPCQAFSIAGKRGGFEDTRGTLFFEIARIAKHKRPRYLLLENVKGLLGHDKGKTFSTILGVLSDLGYGVEWQVLNSKHFGVPQNRERVFIIGHLGGGSRPKVFPLGGGNGKDIKEIGDGLSDAQRFYDTEGVSKTLKARGGGQGAKTGLYAATRGSGGSNASSQNFINEDMKIRRLTPTECERLQGFPDGWTEKGLDEDGNETEISDTQRYKTLGNAVTTNVITAIGKEIVKMN